MIFFIACMYKDACCHVSERRKVFFDRLWSKILLLMSESQAVDMNQTAVMGVRGAETTQTALAPHWENDLPDDTEFKADLQAFINASDACQNGKEKQGISELSKLKNHSIYNMFQARSMLAACYHQQVENKHVKKKLVAFLEKLHEHPEAEPVHGYLKNTLNFNNIFLLK